MRGVLCWLFLLVALGAAEANDRMRFELAAGDCAGCVMAIASGPIDARAADRLVAWLNEHPIHRRPTQIELNSGGGHLMGALRLGRAIRAAGLSTTVSSRPGCRSACAYAFLGGVTRRAEPGTLAVHAASLGSPEGGPALDLPASARRIVAAILSAYVEDMGADVALVEIAFATPPGTLKRLDRRDLATLRIEAR